MNAQNRANIHCTHIQGLSPLSPLRGRAFGAPVKSTTVSVQQRKEVIPVKLAKGVEQVAEADAYPAQRLVPPFMSNPDCARRPLRVSPRAAQGLESPWTAPHASSPTTPRAPARDALRSRAAAQQSHSTTTPACRSRQTSKYDSTGESPTESALSTSLRRESLDCR